MTNTMLMVRCHTHPKEVGLIRIIPVVIWSKYEDLAEAAKKHMSTEFDDYVNIIQLDAIHGLNKIDNVNEIEKTIDRYDFHVIRIYRSKAELILRDNSRYEELYDDLETVLDKFGRKLISFYHQNTY